MRLESVTIKNFRGIREGEIKGLVDVNVLIGRNNCGKSTVAEAITNLARSPHGGGQPDPLGREVIAEWRRLRCDGNDRDLWYRHDVSEAIEILGRISDAGEVVRELGVSAQGGAGLRPTRNEVNENPSNASAASSLAFLPSTFVFWPEDGKNRNIENRVWVGLLGSRRDRLLTRAINDVFGTSAESITVTPDGRTMLLFAEIGLSLDVQGDGLRTAMRCLMALATRENTLMILEEPECHQHPASLRRFASVLCTLARDQGVQLLLTSHSMECVAAFMAAAEQVGAEGATFHLKLVDGSLESRKLDKDTVEGLLDTGLDVRNLDLYV